MSLIADFLDDSHRRLLRPTGGCHNCPRKRVDFVPATLRDTKIILVGEAPGETEVTEQEGFVGSSGKLLRAELAAAGITDYSLTNTIHCRPPKNTTPAAKEVQCCLSQFVLDEVRGYPIVVLVGNVPLQAFFPSSGGRITQGDRYRGNVAWHPDFPGQRFYNIYHPAYILRRKDLEGEFRQQIERLGRILRGEPTAPWKVHRGGGERFWEVLRKSLEFPLISLDIETNRLESWAIDARVRSIAFTADGIDVIFAHEGEHHFIAVLEAVRDFLKKPGKHVVGLNTGFDLDFLEHELEFEMEATSHDVANVWYEAKQYKMPGLKELQSKEGDGYRYLVYRPDDEKDLELLGNYNAEDVVHPLALFKKGMSLLKPRTQDMILRVSGPSSYILRKISTNGFYLRQDYWKDKIKEYTKKQRDIVEAWRVADPMFIPSVHESGNGLLEYLFKLKRLPVLKETEEGDPSTDESCLKEWLRQGHSICQHLLDWREVDKILSTYLVGFEKHVGTDGRIHSQYTSTYTDSVRSSSRKPNLQNIPRVKEIRDLFGVPLGSYLIESDFSQIEFRIMVCLARDEGGIAAYLRGEDAHTQTARAFSNGLPPTKEQRSWAKVVNFALLYGGDAFKVQQWARDQYGLDWTIEQAFDFTDGFFTTYPRIKEYHRIADEELAQNHGWFESITGHIFHYPDWNSTNKGKRDHAFRSHINARAQGPAAQICFLTMVHAHRLFRERRLGVKMVNTVHDSILIEVPSKDLVAPTVAAVEDAKEIAFQWVKDWFIVPLVMDHEVGTSWGSKQDLKDWLAAA